MHDGPTCGAKTRAGHPCLNAPLTGGTRCRMHGGATPRARDAARRRVAEQEATAAARVLLRAAAPVDNPLAAILQLAGEALAWLEALREQAQARLDAGDLVSVGENGESVRAEVALYERALDKAASVLNLAATKNVEARLTALAERDMARVESAYAAVWQAGRDGLPLEEARRRAARHLRSVA
jgi:hypothetical protein